MLLRMWGNDAVVGGRNVQGSSAQNSKSGADNTISIGFDLGENKRDKF